jgi:hypothetical protein
MRHTLESIGQRVDHFNRLLFDGKLPKFPIKATISQRMMAYCKMVRRPDAFNELQSKITLHFNLGYELPEEDWDDIVAHELIHAYIFHNQIPDTSAHGKVFCAEMERINRDFGMHITIRYRVNLGRLAKSVTTSKPRERIVITARLKEDDGIMVCKLLTTRAINLVPFFYKRMMRDPRFYDVELYRCRNAALSTIPCRKAKESYYVAPVAKLRQLLPSTPISLDDLLD